jgi:class 3 adenylate cyclase
MNDMKRNYRIYLMLFGVVVPIILIGAICLLNAVSWVGKPFQGFLIYKLPYAGSLGNRNWTGPQAGLKLMDRILSLNDKPVREGKEVVDLARKMSPGTPVHYSVESKGQIRQVTVPIELFTLMDFIFIFFLPFLCSLLLLAIGTIVCLLKPGASSSWVFFFFCLIVCLYIITGFEIQSTYVFVYLHYFFIPFQGATVFHLGLIFPEPRKLIGRYPKIKYLIYLPAIILGILLEIQYLTDISWLTPLRENIPSLRTITALTRISIVTGVIGFMGSVLFSYYKASSNIVKQRAKVIFFGVTLAFFPTVLLFLFVHFLKMNFPMNLTVYFILSFPASMAYAIIRHNLFDADTIIRRTVGYAVVTAIIIGAYVLVSVSFNILLGKYEIAQSRAFPIIFTLVIILIFNPMRNRIQSLVDRIFFRKEYDYGQIIDKISNAITSLLDLSQILKQLVRTFMEDMFVNTSSVMLLNPAKAEYQVYLADGERKNEIERIILKRDQPLIQIIEKEKKELTKYDVLEDPKYKALCVECARDFENLRATLTVPLVFQDEVIGLINLGEKKSGKFYNREDIDLLRTLANQGAVAIQNARLVDRMKAEEAVRTSLARYLSPQIVDQVIRRDMQVNLGGDRKVVTVLFSDIRNFTQIAETLPPDQLIQLLNEYFTEMARVIFENQGSLDKYIGDAIVAVFGSLIPLENSAEAAVRTAIQMMREMVGLNKKWTDQYGFNMEMGIGINTGEVFLGNIGSPERMEFTVIGDTVNVAARFSGAAKARQILISQETESRVETTFRIQKLPAISVKGKSEEIPLYEVLYELSAKE